MSHNLMGSLNTNPDGLASSLRPPSSRAAMSSNHHLRASADMSGTSSSTAMPDSRMRPSSEIYSNQYRQSQLSGDADAMDKAAQQWITDIDQSERMLEEMAAATLDPVLKDELTAIEQWFRILAEPERTAVLYALLQQTTQIQIRFLIGVLQQMAKKHPMSGVLSPSSYGERDAMSNRLSTALSRLGVDDHPPSSYPVGSGRAPPSPAATTKSSSGLHMDEINSMFPDAAASIAKQKADFTEHTGTAPPPSNRNSTATIDRSSLVAPSISAPSEDQRKDSFGRPPPSPWGPSPSMQHNAAGRPKSSSSSQQPMGQFSQPPPSAGLRSPRPAENTRTATANALDHNGLPPMPVLSPFPGSGNWASMVNTPMTGTFQGQQQQHQGQHGGDQADMVAKATAMRLAALSTVNNRIELDDVRKYRRSRSTEGQRPGQGGQPQGIPANFVMTNERGEVLTPQQAAALQAQQLAAMNGRRSRPSSPSLQVPAGSGGGSFGGHGFGSHQNNGFLAPDGGMGAMSGYLGVAHNDTGYTSDGLDIPRGRSPRGRRGSSKPPEDPTDLELLKDIPAWLRSLRLHKYTDNLKDLHWTELVALDDAGLDKRGVNALGARRKMLKVFDQVREAQATGKI